MLARPGVPLSSEDSAIRTEVHDQLTAALLKPGFEFDGARIPLINPQRGIFNPRQMRFLLSIKTVVPRQGGKVWYDDQREAHRQIYRGEEAVDYAFMGDDPDPADNRWLREAHEHQVPVIYFLGVAFSSLARAGEMSWNSSTRM